MREVTLLFLGFVMCAALWMCRESLHESVAESTSQKPTLLSPPADSSLTPDLRQADSLIQLRAYADARDILFSIIESQSGSVPLQNRAKTMWCYAVIRDHDNDDTAHVWRMLQDVQGNTRTDDTLMLGLVALNKGFYCARKGSDATPEYFDEALAHLSAYYTANDPAMQRHYRDIGSYFYFELNRIQDALELFQKEEALHKVWMYPPLDRSLNAYNLGAIFRDLEEYDIAENQQQQSIAELKAAGLSDEAQGIFPYASMCYLNAQKNDPVRLHAYIDTVLHLVNRYHITDTAELIDYYCSMAMCYSPGYVHEPASGLAILEAIPIDAGHIPAYAGTYGEVYRTKAYLNLGLGKMTEAQNAMLKSIALFEDALHLNNYYEGGYSDALLGLGIFYLEDEKQVQKAMPYIRKAKALGYPQSFEYFSERYPARYLKYYERWYDYLVAYGDQLISSSPLSPDHLSGILRLCERIDSVIATTRQKVTNHDVLRNSRVNHDIYTYMMGWCHDIYSKYHDDRILHKAFDHFEKSRAHLLLTHLSSTALAQQFNVPSKVIDEGMNLTREELATYALLGEEKIDILLERKQAYFLSIKINYPEYYHKSYQPDRTSLDVVRDVLRDDEAMISYQLRDSQLYTMVITRDTIELLKSNFNALCIDAVDALNTIVSKRPSHDWNSTDVRYYTQTAKQVFDCVLGNAYSLIGSKRQWWIAADGVLELLPFEILINFVPENTQSFESLPFLVKDHTIGYILSATTWVKETKQDDPMIDKIAAFIHSDGVHTVRSLGLERDVMEYQGMPGTAKAAASIKEVYGSRVVDIYANSKATTTTFLNSLNEYDILHLGLHAYADTTGRQRHGIVFPGDKAQLKVSDLIGKNIRASIVFLEGCETGVGRQERGEGMLNFARPFIAAGARHVLASRWKLDDQTAGEMAGYFYQQLKTGNSVAFANCEAKRMFLEKTGRLQSHPYYWAAVMSVQ